MKIFPPVLTFIVLLSSSFFLSCKTMQAPIEYKPNDKMGPVVVILSGHTGPHYYLTFASRLSRLGYYAVVSDSNDFTLRDHAACELKLSEIITIAKRSPHALPGRVAVIGYSMGGGIALAYAANRPESVSAVIAYYPMTFRMGLGIDIESLAERFIVPISVFQGEEDSWQKTIELLKKHHPLPKK